jgi:hypothetical protein
MKNRKSRDIYHTSLMIALLFILVSQVTTMYGQRRTHNMGDFSYYIDMYDVVNMSNQPFFSETGHWPQDYYRHGHVVYNIHGLSIREWIDDRDQVRNNWTETWHWERAYWDAPEYGMKEYRRQEPPRVFVEVDGELVISGRHFDGIVVPDLPSDMMIELKYNIGSPGVDVTLRSYSFANENLKDFVIKHYQYVVTYKWFGTGHYGFPPGYPFHTDSTQVLKDVYFFRGYSFFNHEGAIMNQTQWPSEYKGSWSTYEEIPSALVAGRTLPIAYGWDGNHPDIGVFEPGGKSYDNTGNPRFGIGTRGQTLMPSAEFISSAYAGYVTLHVDKSSSDRSNDTAQPKSVVVNANISDVWQRAMPGFASWWHWANSRTKERAEDGAGWPNNPGVNPGKLIFKSYGPYDLALGDTVNIVYAVGANGISRELAEEKGREWLRWYRGEAGASFDDGAKNELIATGRDSLIQTMDRALWVWERGMDVPFPLPSPNLTIIPFPHYIQLEWEDLAAKYPTVDHYRIYGKRGEYHIVDTHEELRPDGVRWKWELIAEVPKNQTSYIDENVIRGEPYFYGVTVVDDGTQHTDGLFPGQKLESSRYTNRSQIPAVTFQPGEPTAANVRIVPNPYISLAGDYNFADDNKLLFVNLPPFCTIRIYNVAGDLVKTIEHMTGRADNSWDQVTDYNQLVASGVYILHISNARGIDGEPISGTIEKFVIIR